MHRTSYIHPCAPGIGQFARLFTLRGVAVDAARHTCNGTPPANSRKDFLRADSSSRPSQMGEGKGRGHAKRQAAAAKSKSSARIPMTFRYEQPGSVTAPSFTSRACHIYKVRV